MSVRGRIILARTNVAGLWLLVPWGAAWVAAIGGVITRQWMGVAVGAAMGASVGLITAVWMWVFYGRNAILADDEGLIVVTRGRARRSFAWSEVSSASWAEEMFWFSPGPSIAGRLVVAPRGGRWDTPGPNSPAEVGRVFLVLPRHRREASARIDRLLREKLDDSRTS